MKTLICLSIYNIFNGMIGVPFTFSLKI
jgi:hypothetical protein